MKQITNKTTIEMLAEIEKLVYSPIYDDLNDYFTGIRDILNFLNNNDYATSYEVYEHIKEEYTKLYDNKGALRE